MRLSSLKLSGFKSFADPTTLQFKADRSAVVGPNGCGKSNVIDAIRWVMGESSARQLRGGTMQDVIFTGTAKRKPVGLASVELRFENTLGKLGGAYNAYTELAVRRQVTRDGKSEYFLNGTKCRKRDITDIFLGTGLGPRSYAIIEQGMINRMVDAKPEEMRIFIEEAAGISRYQARRRETLQHLEHTTQNLSRLEDIAGELKGQLKTLKKQAEKAIQYQTLEKKIDTLKVEILSVQCEQSTQLQQEYTLELDHLGIQFKEVKSELGTIEHDLTSTSELFERLLQQSSPLQQQLQHADQQLSSLSMTLEQKKALLEQNRQTLAQLQQQKVQNKEKQQILEIQIDTLQTEEDELHESTQASEQGVIEKAKAYETVQTQYKAVEAEYTVIQSQLEKNTHKREQLTAQTQYLQKNILRLVHQQETLQAQMQHAVASTKSIHLADLQQQYQDDEAQISLTQTILKEDEQKAAQLEAQFQKQKQKLNELSADLKSAYKEEARLKETCVRPEQSKEHTLIDVLQLNDEAKPHANIIEKFLEKWLNARVLSNNEKFEPVFARQIKSGTPQLTSAVLTLAHWIKAPQLDSWNNVLILNSFEDALKAQAQLLPEQTILTLDGYYVAKDWMIGLHYEESAEKSLTHQLRLEAVQSEIQQLEVQHKQQKEQVAILEETMQQQREIVQAQNTQLMVQQKQLQQLNLEITKIESTQNAFVVQHEQVQKQLKELQQQQEEDATQKDDIEIDLHALELKIEQQTPLFKDLEMRLNTLLDEQEHKQKEYQASMQKNQDFKQQLIQVQRQVELLQKDFDFLKNQSTQTQRLLEQTQALVEPIEQVLPDLEQQHATQQHVVNELKKEWDAWQQQLNQQQTLQKTLTEKRHELQQQEETLRAQLEQKRLAWQTTASDLAHYQQQLHALNATVLTGLDLNLDTHQTDLEYAQHQFSKLGAVNLAASAEYEEISKRHEELSHQIQDLENTVDQLQKAMKSIDQETKKLFMTTFDQVNAELQVLFPKVFNGGEASLTLESDWQSGVKLMARPPGKRNSSLALLSGGEKALTALALVFAIFRLNPAPFCVLDEVDAPLDDANVQRFCNLVKELSEQVQFIYITHNKLAMTMATDLLGVTMPEPGTSKLVTVNLEQAKEYGLVGES